MRHDTAKLSRQRLIHPHELRHAFALGHVLDGEPIRLHDGPVVLLVGLPQLRRHGGLVVEVGQGAVGIEGPGVQDGLGGLLDFGLLCIGGGGTREVIVNDIYRVSEIAFNPPTYSSYPSVMHIRAHHSKMIKRCFR